MNSSAGVTTQPSLSTRVKVWFDSLPFVTRVVLVTCLGIYLAGALIGFDDYGKVCLSADRVLWHGEVWRFFTAAMFHMGALHVAFNMLAFVPIGMSLERALGSVAFAYLMLLLVVLGDAAFVFFSFIAAFGPARLGGEWVRQCAVGLSGVIFGLIVADNATNHANHRSIFGFFNVPAAVYPWALLVFWQLIMPGASFLGHLCGVLIGQLYMWGLLKWLLLPDRAVRLIEGSRLCAPVYSRTSFIAASGPLSAATGGAPPLPVSHTPASSGGGADQQRGNWLSGGWLRLPGSDPAEGGGGIAGRSTGLFGLGGGHGTAAAFAGQGRTVGASDRVLPQGVPAYAANAGLSAAPMQPPPTYPAGPNIAGGASTARAEGAGGQPPSSGGRSASSSTGYSTISSGGGSGGGGGGRKLDPHAVGAPAMTARSAAAAAAEARAKRFGGATADGGGPPTRPASVPGSPPSSSRGNPTSLRSARSADSSSLHQALRPRSPSVPIAGGQHEAAGGEGKENEPQSEALQQLVAMGFAEVPAAEALRAASDNVPMAVALLSGD